MDGGVTPNGLTVLRRALRKSAIPRAAEAAEISEIALEAFASDAKVQLPARVIQRLTAHLFGGGASFDFATDTIRMTAGGEDT
jgi:hypothetical protein